MSSICPCVRPRAKALTIANGVSFLLSAIIESASGMSAFEYAKRHLLAPLGITDVTWPADPQGVTVGYGEMWLKPRDMAKFGQLYLDNGRWDGRQVVWPAWVAKSTRPRVDATLFAKYGYQWWHDAGDYYAAVGFRGQFIFVVPRHNMVVVFTSDLPAKDYLLIRDTPPVGIYVLNMFCIMGSRLWGSRLHRACVV